MLWEIEYNFTALLLFLLRYIMFMAHQNHKLGNQIYLSFSVVYEAIHIQFLTRILVFTIIQITYRFTETSTFDTQRVNSW